MSAGWSPEPAASLVRRLGKSPEELGATGGTDGCPDIWELSNGDFAIIGRDLTAAHRERLPEGASITPSERLVVIPRATLLAAKADIPDA